MTQATVLISSAGRRGALVESARMGLDALGTSGRVITADMSLLTAAGQLADANFQVPASGDPAYIESMLALCERESVDLLVPTIDTELATLAEHRSDFASLGTTVSISDPECVAITADKISSSRWLSDNGFAVPAQHNFDEAIAGEHGWPLFFKPIRGSSSIGALRVDTPQDLETAAASWEGVVEELVEGAEYTVDVYVDSGGVARCAVPRLRIATRAGEIAKGMTVRRTDVQELASQIASRLPGARGTITVQIMDGQSGPRVIEINPRFGGGYPLSWQAGVRYLEAALHEAQGLTVGNHFFEWTDQIVMLRYDAAVFVSAAEVGL